MEKKIIDYKVVLAESSAYLANAVKDNIKSGWQPIGGINVTNDNSNRNYYQAMVKYES